MSRPTSDIVELTMPCRPEYVGVARLAILGVAGEMPFSYDEVEDIRLAVGEACTRSVERAGGNDAFQIRITSTVRSDTLVIDVADNVPPGSDPDLPTEEASSGVDQKGLSTLLMGILVDEVAIKSQASGTTVRMTKVAPEERPVNSPVNRLS